MAQQGVLFLQKTSIAINFPDASTEVIPGVNWGAIECFPSPAYWAFQVFSRRMTANKVNYKLGTTLTEEVGACLLGGHGISSQVGLAAYQHLKSLGAFEKQPPCEAELKKWLLEPLNINGKKIRYRFAGQKAKYLAGSLKQLSEQEVPVNSGKELRNWLLNLPGIGHKTASWIARNWLDADDIAILDIHILRAGLLAGFFPNNLSVEKDYLELEERFLLFSKALGVRPAELDVVIWMEMMSSSKAVEHALNRLELPIDSKNRRLLFSKKKVETEVSQAVLFA